MMACNLLSFQGLQAERRDSIPLCSTKRDVEISTFFFFWFHFYSLSSDDDRPSAQHDITVIQNGRLTRCDSTLGFIEEDLDTIA